MTRFKLPRVARCCEGAQTVSRAGHKKAHPARLAPLAAPVI